MDSWINLSAVWRIVVVSLLVGAGLPALFALGIRGLAAEGRPVPGTSVSRATVLAFACFAIVLAAVGCGIAAIVAGL
ncbi:MAG TPA: hypothetical protein VF288_05920 [Mycobacteriales bacterium]